MWFIFTDGIGTTDVNIAKEFGVSFDTRQPFIQLLTVGGNYTPEPVVKALATGLEP